MYVQLLFPQRSLRPYSQWMFVDPSQFSDQTNECLWIPASSQYFSGPWDRSQIPLSPWMLVLVADPSQVPVFRKEMYPHSHTCAMWNPSPGLRLLVSVNGCRSMICRSMICRSMICSAVDRCMELTAKRGYCLLLSLDGLDSSHNSESWNSSDSDSAGNRVVGYLAQAVVYLLVI